MKKNFPIIPILVFVVVVGAIYLYNRKVEGFSVMCCPTPAVDLATDRCKVRPMRVENGHKCHNMTLPYNKKHYKGAIVTGSYVGVAAGL